MFAIHTLIYNFPLNIEIYAQNVCWINSIVNIFHLHVDSLKIHATNLPQKCLNFSVFVLGKVPEKCLNFIWECLYSPWYTLKEFAFENIFSGNFRTSPRGQWVNAEEKSVHSNSYTKDALATLQHPLQSCDQSQALYMPKTDRGVLVNIGSGYGWLAAGQMPVPVDALVPIFVRLSAVTLMIKYEI